MENLNYNMNKDALLHENPNVFVTKSNSFEFLNEETCLTSETREINKEFMMNKAYMKITSR